MSVKKQLCLAILIMGLLCGQAATAQVQRTVKRSVATMLFSTLGGAILGISTLPFYGEPQEHIDNVTMGALLGGLAGAGYLAYDASRSYNQAPAYDYSQIEIFHEKNKRSTLSQLTQVSAIQWNLSF